MGKRKHSERKMNRKQNQRKGFTVPKTVVEPYTSTVNVLYTPGKPETEFTGVWTSILAFGKTGDVIATHQFLYVSPHETLTETILQKAVQNYLTPIIRKENLSIDSFTFKPFKTKEEALDYTNELIKHSLSSASEGAEIKWVNTNG